MALIVLARNRAIARRGRLSPVRGLLQSEASTNSLGQQKSITFINTTKTDFLVYNRQGVSWPRVFLHHRVVRRQLWRPNCLFGLLILRTQLVTQYKTPVVGTLPGVLLLLVQPRRLVLQALAQTEQLHGL